ncbi:MAG: VCBS repeat-containing protein [Candidatus Marinimicrobia bacterium]|nr:VCBS repeat-containing protein [Candidatus Neomarinimicrobiota bacterium]
MKQFYIPVSVEKTFFTRIKIFTYFFLISLISASDLQITHLNGVFDLDNDDLVEFLTIEEGRRLGRLVTMTGYYEIDELGFPQLLWFFETPRHIRGRIVTSHLADLDGSGTPSLVVGVNALTGDAEEISLAVIYLFDWVQGEFSESPAITLSLSSLPQAQILNNFVVIDLEGDGREELAISLQGAERTLSVLSLVTIDDTKQLIEKWSITLDKFNTSSGQLFVAGLDYNRDGQSDLIAFSPERNVLRVQFFINREGTLVSGPNALHRVPGMSEVLYHSLVTLDWDNNNRDDLLIPFRSGHVVSISPSDRTIDIRELGIDAGPLSDLKQADFNQDGRQDLLLVSGQQGIVTLAYGGGTGEIPLQESYSVARDETNGMAQIFSVLPEIVDDIYLGTVIAGGWTGKESEIFYFELGILPEYPEEILVDTYIPQTKIEETIKEPAPSVPMEGVPLPPGILPSYILPVHQTFAFTISEEDDREFFSFRWLTSPPRGMYFHYETRSIEWVPDDTQLGAYELFFNLRMKVGETVDIITSEEDSIVMYQVVPELASLDQRFWIYVNDPPVITSTPPITEFVAGTLFSYQLIVTDANEDAYLHYSLEKSPEGMTVDQTGFISWQTDDSHVNIYGVRAVVSDGFDRDVQSFRLYSRGQVVITSEPVLEASVNEFYQYQLAVQIPKEKQQELHYSLFKSPYGMMVDHTGLVTWTPQSTQIDTQKYVVVVNHGIAADTQHVAIFVNHPPVLTMALDPMTKVSLFDTLDFRFEAYEPNEFDIVRYNPVEMPPGMRIDPATGRLLWVPTEENLDFSTAVIEITDGHVFIEKTFDFYVNATIHIISEPPTLAAVGKPYTYQIGTHDLNQGSLMTFARVTPVYDFKSTKVYAITIEDDVYRENIERYIGEFKSKKSILIEFDEKGPDREDVVARVNLKKFVQNIFYEDDQLIVVTKRVGGRWIKIKDILWHFFEGNKGKPPKVLVDRLPLIRYTLLDFPDGMFVDELTGVLTWTPSLKQYDSHTIAFMVSDGYTKDEQSFDLYVNHAPTIISTPPKTARVDQIYKYKVVVEDKNRDKKLTYELLKSPKGMQITRDGKITWIPTASQINSRLFSVKVSDGYSEDRQESKLFVNMPPSVISQPKPVALTNFEYRYRMAVEDLNGDKVKLRPVKLPKYARFDEKTGLLRWKPRMNQRGVNDIIITAIDERGAATSHEFQIHVFEDPSTQQFISTSWPLLLAFVGAIFTVGVTAIR